MKLCIWITALVAALDASSLAAQSSGDATAVAVVNGSPVTFLQVKRVLAAAVKNRPVPAEMLPALQAQALEQTILRRLVIDRLKEWKYEPTEAELKTAAENFDANLTLAGISKDEYLRRNYLSESDLDDLRYWEICWNRYVAAELTDEELKQYYDEHRRDFDGTELRVSHILWRVEGRGASADANSVAATARGVRDEILSGKLTFAAAAKQYSIGPSREDGGDLGFIRRREPMVEDFNTAAFKLNRGEISPPVATSFGVHLITVTDERPGSIPWTEVREPLAAAAENALFHKLAAELRKTAKVEYANLVPHLDPATGQVVVPAKTAAPSP